MLRWRSVPEWGGDCVAVSFPRNAANTSVMHNNNQIAVELPYLQKYKL